MRFRITIVILLALFASAVVAQDPPPPADRTAIFEQTSTKFFDSFKLKK